MVSFGNASGPLEPINVPKDLQPKGLYFTRPSIAQYFTNRKELQAGSDEIFEKVKYVFDKSNIKLKVLHTEYAGHAFDLANSLDYSNYDGLCAIGGDGTMYEMINGMLKRKDKQKEYYKRPKY